MFNPIRSAIGDKSYRVLARELIEAQSALGQGKATSKPITFEALAARLGELNSGKNLGWWKDRPDLTNFLIGHINKNTIKISRDDLGFEQLEGPHMFKFMDAPDLPCLDLRRKKHWDIAKPRFMPQDGTNRELNYSTRYAMGYWMAERDVVPSSKEIEWLHVHDDLEFELLTRRIQALGNRNILMCTDLGEVYTEEENYSDFLSQNPLIISVQTSTSVQDLHKLIDERNDAPLLVISRFPLPTLTINAGEKIQNNPKDTKDTGKGHWQKINCWEWVFLENWRDLLLSWIGQRLDDPNNKSHFVSGEVKKWLVELDPNYLLVQSTRDVLLISQLVSKHSETILEKHLSSELGLGMALIKQILGIEKSGRDLLKQSIEAHWNRLDIALEGDLLPDIWKTLSNDKKQGTDKLFTSDSNGLNFKNPMVFRLVLRDLLIEKIKKEPMHEWANACFDPERRRIVDAALDACSMDDLAKVARCLEEKKEAMVFIAVAEALFMAIGRKIHKILNEKKLNATFIPEDVKCLIVYRVFEGLDFSQDLAQPWSRPLNSKSEQIEWVLSCWAWSLLPLPKGISAPNKWLFPGWSNHDQLPADLPGWLIPRASLASSQQDDSLEGSDHSGYAQNADFIAVVEEWLSARNGELTTRTIEPYLPTFLKIGLLRQAAKGKWKTDFGWWHGIIGTPWAEAAVSQNLKSPYKDGSLKTMAMNWWPSLVAHIQYRFEEEVSSGFPNPLRSKSSPVFNWVIEQLETDCSKALGQLDDKARSFLEKNPQLLNRSFKLELLKSLALRLPSDDWFGKNKWQARGFLLNFGVDAVDGLDAFIHDELLGYEAAQILWKWAPDKAENLLCHDETIDIEAKRNLIKTCLPGSVAAAIESLQRDKNILNSGDLKSWVHLHLPNARNHAAELLGLIPVPYACGDEQVLLH